MPESDDADTGPIDVEVLGRIAQRLAASNRFSAVTAQPESAPNSVIADFELRYSPAAVSRA